MDQTTLPSQEPESHRALPFYDSLPFYSKQVRIVLSNCGIIDPERIEAYLARDGYQGLGKALGMSPDEVISEVTDAGLRGRGGAGFSTGLKWEFARRARARPKFVICNADEGDPGAFMDRSILEGDPHSVIEGMAIAGYAIGAPEGYIYCRAEYPLAIARLKTAIAQAHEYGLLGEHILGSDFSFDLHLKEGAGAFVCGEEMALIASVEGRRGEPRPKPPFPAVSGLWSKPTTVVNNVKSYAMTPRSSCGAPIGFGHRHAQVAGHGGLRAHRQDQEHRPDRSADGHHPARDHLRHRRRHPERASSSRPCRPAGPWAAVCLLPRSTHRWTSTR